MVDLDLMLAAIKHPTDIIVRNSIRALAGIAELVKVREGVDGVVQTTCKSPEYNDRVLLLQLYVIQ
jgi:hypothetical protein